MSVKILESKDGECCFYQSTADWAFGPIMENREQAEVFLEWLKGKGIRSALISDGDLEGFYYDFRVSRELNIDQKSCKQEEGK